jgi:hypothetical protein
MTRTTVLSVVTLAFVMLASSISAVAQAPQAFDRPTADELYQRAGGLASAHRTTRMMIASASAPTQQPIAVLHSPGSIVSTPTASIGLDVKADFGRPVWIAGRVFSTDDQGQLAKYGKAFYANKSLALTRNGPGYFPTLSAGAVIPFGEVPTGNPGDLTVVEVTMFDAQNGGVVLQTLSTSFWNRVKPVSASVVPGCIPTSAYSSTTGEPCSPVTVTSASILADGASMVVSGSFPVGQSVVVEIGDPEWDAGFVTTSSGDGKTLCITIPSGKNGNLLYPRMWSAQLSWSVVVQTLDGTSVTAPSLLQVEGNASNLGVSQVQ